jgi:hypothetical protein
VALEEKEDDRYKLSVTSSIRTCCVPSSNKGLSEAVFFALNKALKDVFWNRASDQGTADTPRKQHLFYLAHPMNAQYRTDIPAKYYIVAFAECQQYPGLSQSRAQVRCARLFRMSRTSLCISNKDSSVTFERVEHNVPGLAIETDQGTADTPRKFPTVSGTAEVI